MIGYHANGDYWLVGLLKWRISQRRWLLNSCPSFAAIQPPPETSQKPGVNYPARSLVQQFATDGHPIPLGFQPCLVKQDGLPHLGN